MKYVFLVAYQKGNKNLIKVRTSEGKEIWATTSSAVYEYAKKSCQKESEYEVQTEEKNGQLYISRIGNDSPAPRAETAKSTAYTCEDCGATLKDGKYKKCYLCNKKNPVKKEETKTEEKKPYVPYTKSPEVQESIAKQAIMKAAADAVATAMQGQVGDIDTLAEMIIKLYEKLYDKIR